MYNYRVGDVWDGVILVVDYGVCLGKMLTF